MHGSGRAVRRFALAALAGILGATQPGWAQDAAYPNRPIRMIVGFAAGGGNDLFARVIGQKLSEQIGQTVVIENKPGAGGRLAVDFVKNQPADGYTLMVGATGQMSVAAAIYPNLGYHPTRDFVPITMIASFPLILAGPVDDKIKAVKDLVAFGKANPDKSNYATSSPAFTITTELFKLKTGAPGTPIPYKSSNESLVSVIGEQSLLTIADPPPTTPLVKGGQVRALAVLAKDRSPDLPDVPTMTEAGVPDVNVSLWSGMFAPAGTPPDIVKKLEAELMKIMRMPDVQEKFKAMATPTVGSTAAEFTRVIEEETKMWSDVGRTANVKLE